MTGARDDAWMESLICAHRGQVRRYVAWRLPAGEVDDAVAEVFAAAWKDRARVPDDGLPWLLACARLRVLNAAAARTGGRELLSRVHQQAELSQQPPPDLEWVWTVLEQLEPEDRDVLCLYAWDGLSSAQVGQVLGCAAVTARVRLLRARRRARKAIEALNAAGDHQSGAPDRTRPSRVLGGSKAPANSATPPGCDRWEATA